ncbi:hypothetical protein SAMN02745751_03141 [Dethiosulfatibacter aminovorans DSM 17477]|uniref:Uncharacterized protein n=1 Tax=Dethiosulfatibacter aminovorans DSM 17477 TaxID=1121476 RepID=A0A1M6LCQ4_9FIRM|nr:hypothetical protein [Dethiosulfatibacter aminovorans]SHJ68952.1 hypothetical protein SAMN02745751_03141 [Dethiosulfatibacter aminovorans DSM 17477]
MDKIVIEESGMKFGPFSKENVYYIEKEDVYTKRFYACKISEFFLKAENDKDEVYSVVEAKSSSPKPGSKERFPEFIKEINEKFINTFNIILSLRVGRDHLSEFQRPEFITRDDLGKVVINFILVINGHKKEWLPPLRDALYKEMKAYLSIYDINILVMNDELALKHRLIS